MGKSEERLSDRMSEGQSNLDGVKWEVIIVIAKDWW